MNMKILIDVLILIFVIFFGSLNGECFDVNIKYSCGKLNCNENLLSTKAWRWDLKLNIENTIQQLSVFSAKQINTNDNLFSATAHGKIEHPNIFPLMG